METARALTENLLSLLRREHDALAQFLVALAEFDRRRLWVDLGHSSFFYFLHRELRLSLGAAQHRKVAAELIEEIPGIIEPLRRGDLCLSSIIEVAKVVTPENWETVLPRFYGLSRREAMEVVAELQPHPAPPIRTVVTPVRSAPACRGGAPVPPALALGDAAELQAPIGTSASPISISLSVISPGEMGLPLTAPCAPSASLSVSPPVVPPVPLPGKLEADPVTVEPLTPDLSRLHVTVSKGLLKKLEAATDAMSHAMPGATPAEILEAGLDLLLAQAAKRRGMVEKPQKKVRPAKGDHIPAHVRREVWERDGGKCQWKLASGGICGATRNLELDHIRPRSLGGTSTADDLRVVCRQHNDLAARLVLGEDLMNRYTSGLRGARTGMQRWTGVRERRGGSSRASDAPDTAPA